MIESEIWPVLIIGAIGLVALWPWGKSEHTEGDEWHDYRPKAPPPVYERKFVYVHPVCGKPAFYIDALPRSGDIIRSRGITLLNGQNAQEGTPCICGSCGENLHPMMIRNFKECTQ